MDSLAKILLVDDEAAITDNLAPFLERAGYSVAVAGNGEEALQQVASFAPDLIILDVMMDQPDDGIVMAQTLRYEGNKTPILMLTSVSKVIGLELGQDDEVVPVDAFCEKPLEPATLVRKVAELLSRGGAA
jgi:DNA-binding response OmpR family regulator